MMHQTGYFKYHADAQNKFAAVELPYQVQYEQRINNRRRSYFINRRGA